MSATKVQSNTSNKSSPMTPTNSSRAIYFDCGEIFTANNATENSNNNNSSNDHNNITVSLTDLNMININCSNDSSMDPVNRIGQIVQQTQSRILNNQYRFHATLNRTASTPQPQRYHNQFHNHQQQFHMQQQPRPSQKQPRQQQELPQITQHYSNVGSLVNTIAPSLGNINIRRKLERTQSEPMPPQEATITRYKTELCRPFDERGECKYGEKCQFAHGQHELRSLQRHPKYKTEICRTYHSSGFCPYGSRCHFLHDFEEQTPHQEQQLQLRRQNTLQQQNHSNFYALGAASSLNNVGYAAMGGSVGAINHPLPMTPPLSMSTGSDRESPLSISPTSSMTNFSFGDQISPAISFQNPFQSTFTYASTPPESPNALMSPISTPPPSLMLAQTSLYIEPVASNSIGFMNAARQQKPAVGQALQKSFSSPIAVVRSGHINTNTSASAFATNTYNPQLEVNSTSLLNGAASLEETRLPVFNRISRNSNAEIFSHVAL